MITTRTGMRYYPCIFLTGEGKVQEQEEAHPDDQRRFAPSRGGRRRRRPRGGRGCLERAERSENTEEGLRRGHI